MTDIYHIRYLLCWLGVWVGALLLASPSRAQSGPYGNEWIVPSQQYYKIKVSRDGIYRLDYAYLTQAGISGVSPQRFQLWRRGKQVAIFVGPDNPTTLGPTTYIEFYGQRNDGALDAGMYKTPADHYQKHYSLYTDTASYFLTWAATGPVKRMASSSVAPTGGAHPYWLKNRLWARNERYSRVNEDDKVYQPWGEAGEGFMSYSYGKGGGSNDPSRMFAWQPDTLSDMLPAGGPAPRVEMLLTGASSGPHQLTVSAQQTSSTATTIVVRPLGPAVVLQGFEARKLSYPFLRSDVYPNGFVGMIVDINNAVNPASRNWFRMVYQRLIYPSAAGWPSGRRDVPFTNDSTLGSAAAFYQLENVPATVRGFDVTDPYNVQRIEGSGSGSRRSFVFPSATPQATRRLLLSDLAWARTPLPAHRVQFRAIAPAAYNFLIVSSAALMKPTPGSSDPVSDYAAYRAARFSPLVVTSEELYDQFHYGEKSALAVRQFAQFMLTDARPKSLLLLGHGVAAGEAIDSTAPNRNYFIFYYRNQPKRYLLRSGDPLAHDLVPTSTEGASDAFFTADWSRGDYAARMATGRLAATTPAEVLAYLNKLKEYESKLDASLETQPWRKNALNLLGAKTESEFRQFAPYLEQYKRQIEKPLFGGKVINTFSTAGIVTTKNIAAELNAGLGLITYFGHGGADLLQLDLGDINNASNGYNNGGKYPVMFVNGCAAGNAYRGLRATYPQSWLFAEQKGLIGFMSESSTGFEDNVHVLQTKMYDLLLNDATWYGRSVAEAQNEAVRQLQRAGRTEPSAISNMLTTTWHADPALRLYSLLKPDYAFGAPALEIKPVGPDPVRAKSTSYTLVVRVKNTGKLTSDRLDFLIERKYDGPATDNRPPDTYIRSEAAPTTTDEVTYTFTLPNPASPAKVFGNSTFTVKLDYQNRIEELNEGNNQAQVDFVFLQDGISLLNPPEFALVAPGSVRLVGQTNDPAGPPRGFELELDTVPTFNSAWLQRTKVQAPLLADWRPQLPQVAGRDGVVWYWRMRFETKLTPDETNEWSVSSFRVVRGTTGGWSQSHHGQFRRDELKQVAVAAPSGKWSFSEVTQRLALSTRGGGTGGVTYEPGYGIRLGNEPVDAVDCGIGFPNMLVSVFDGSTLRPLRTLGGGPYDSCGAATNRYYHFALSATDNINTPARQAQLLALLSRVPAGAYVALVSINKVDFTSFSPALKAAIAALGAQKVGMLQDGDPYVLFSHKVAGAPVAQEATADSNSPVPRSNQVVTLNGILAASGSSGTLTSTRIGPAQQWTSLQHTIRTEASDSYTLKLVGISADGTSRVLAINVKDPAYSLAGISAKEYPYLQLELELRDEQTRTAPQVEQLLVTYVGVPEGVVRRDSVLAAQPAAYEAAGLAKQATETGQVKVPVIFQNVAGLPFGTPLTAVFTLRSATKESTQEIDLTSPGTNAAVRFEATLNVLELFGDITGSVTLNVNRQGRRLPELYYFNNELTLPTFRVEDRSVPPVLDVAFDGQHILNGDIVSPRPIITVLLTDEDKLRPITDRTAFSVVLTKQNGAAQPVNLNGANVRFRADPAKGTAQLEYEPGLSTPLEDGHYSLQVQGRDATGRAAGASSYQVSFEVVNAASITHVYPYPNPITHSAQFVFTLTGQQVPRNLKIQILTLTGKVVRQILLEELGPVRIGHNISAYRWEGTDEYGQRLANGTYLYRVVLDQGEQKLEHRATAADQAFKNGWGKLVLLR
ncbi:putative type IX secretion system sortase PorU2 [Hymenobacter metallicola]|uniref:Gingipain domain-containing protein n=1 Tax=Hymenobacter metallicola TaxID=2563114 RepID=A0A4Z0QFT9_9BACT|nr:C25 family cysteine peptidase [Hymenobacter metallicola]TGE28083.1 hypothetical protein E5K02_01050 [Hymenobacter metallicola]